MLFEFFFKNKTFVTIIKAFQKIAFYTVFYKFIFTTTTV